MRFCFCKWNWGTDFVFQKTDFENSKKLESIVNIFVFFIEISSESKESPLSRQFSLFSSTRLFLEKIFHPHSYCLIRGTQSPLYKGWGSNYDQFNFADDATPYVCNSNLKSVLETLEHSPELAIVWFEVNYMNINITLHQHQQIPSLNKRE